MNVIIYIMLIRCQGKLLNSVAAQPQCRSHALLQNKDSVRKLKSQILSTIGNVGQTILNYNACKVAYRSFSGKIYWRAHNTLIHCLRDLTMFFQYWQCLKTPMLSRVGQTPRHHLVACSTPQATDVSYLKNMPLPWPRERKHIAYRIDLRICLFQDGWVPVASFVIVHH